MLRQFFWSAEFLTLGTIRAACFLLVVGAQSAVLGAKSHARPLHLPLVRPPCRSAAGKALELFLAVLQALEYARQSGSTLAYLEV